MCRVNATSGKHSAAAKLQSKQVCGCQHVRRRHRLHQTAASERARVGHLQLLRPPSAGSRPCFTLFLCSAVSCVAERVLCGSSCLLLYAHTIGRDCADAPFCCTARVEGAARRRGCIPHPSSGNLSTTLLASRNRFANLCLFTGSRGCMVGPHL